MTILKRIMVLSKLHLLPMIRIRSPIQSLAHPNNLGAVTIYDDDSPPTITVIADNGDAIESSGSAGFKLTATGLTATTTLMINATPVESGSNFLTTGASGTATNYSVEFTDPDGDNTYDGELSVPLINDSVGEGPGDITLTVNASPIVYRLNLNTVSVITMWDDDAPQLKVTAGESVTEGVNGSVDFHISTPVSPNKFINVRYNLVDSFNSITDEGLGKITRLDFTNGKKMATLSFTLVDDSHVGIDGAVSLTLIADNANPITYLVAPSPDNSGIIHVQDDDNLPWVSVASNSRNIEAIEGLVNVNLSSEGLNQTTTLTLNATLTETGSNFLLNGTSNVAKDYEIEFSDPDGDNTYSGVFPVPIVSDAITEVSGNILLTFNADPRSVDSYRLRPANQSRIRIYDDDAPELAISAMGSVTEAENVTADFVVTAKVSPYDYLTVRYNLSETHNFIDNEGRDKSARLDFTSGKTEATLSIPIVSDTRIEQNGSVIVLLTADTTDPITYTVAPSPNHFASVIVRDDDSLPIISIAADSGDFPESNDPVKFMLTATGLTATTTLNINATPAEEGGDFLTGAVQDTAANHRVEFTDPDGDGTYNGELSVYLFNDGVGEVTGTIKLTLNVDPSALKSYQLGSTTEGMLTIWDDDAPELKITAGDPVTEGESVNANFTISAEVSPNRMVAVGYDLAESQNFIDNEGTGKTAILDFRTNVKEVILPIAITQDTMGEDSGTITVTLNADSDPIDYTVAAAPNNSAQVHVFDDDRPPVVVIEADSGDFPESDDPAKFMLTATGLSITRTLVINATPAEVSSDFLTETVAGTPADYSVEFTDPDGDNIYSGELPVNLHNDTAGEATGDIKLTLNASSAAAYRLGSTTAGVLTVWDDDAPELKITAGDPVAEAEGAVANFVISAEVSPDDSIMVRYDLAESQNFIANEGTGKTTSLDFSSDTKEVMLPISITNDSDTETNGSITVTLTADIADPIKYTVATAPNNSAVINVVDDDSLPTISILANSGSAKETDGTAHFILSTSDLTAATTLSINATPAEDGGDFLADEFTDTAIDYPVIFADYDLDGTYTGEFTVPIDSDTIREMTSNIKLTLNAKPLVYNLGATTEGVLAILDDDAPELKITAGNSITESANVSASFVVSAEISPNDNIEVHYDLTESQNFIANEGTGKTAMLNFSNRARRVTLPIPITSDMDSEEDGTITVTLTADDADPIKYTVAAAPNNSASVQVIDDDSLPFVSIVADSGEVAESEGTASFNLTATGLDHIQQL